MTTVTDITEKPHALPHAHHGAGHDHHHGGHGAVGKSALRSAPAFSLLRVSLAARLGLAVVLSVVTWGALVWAMA